ncbi:MAG: NfeD family protein [Eubacterium sp.]|nr:NfeD family protein [Eubacterium sp.]
MTMTVLWLIVVAVMLVIEIFTMGLTTIWFSIGAVAAAVASGLSAPVWLQIVLFAAVSVLVMLLVRPFAMKVMDSGKMKTNLDEIAGQKVRVLEEINNSEGTGKVMYRGVEWMARSVDDTVIVKDSMVTVQSISGVKLMVTK